MFEEPHARCRALTKHLIDLLGSIQRDRDGVERSMNTVVIHAPGCADPQRCVDTETIEIGDACPKSGLLHFRSQALPVQQQSWSPGSCGSLGSLGSPVALRGDGLNQRLLCVASKVDPVQRQETRQQPVTHGHRCTVTSGQEFDDVDRGGVRVARSGGRLNDEVGAVERTRSAQFRHREIHALLHAGPGVQPDEHANGIGDGIGSGDEADIVTGGGGSDVSRAFAAHPARIDERSRAGRHQGADRGFAKTRVEVTGCIRGVGQEASARDDGSGNKARHSDARSNADARCPSSVALSGGNGSCEAKRRPSHQRWSEDSRGTESGEGNGKQRAHTTRPLHQGGTDDAHLCLLAQTY